MIRADGPGRHVASIVIPAHNEASVLPRLLEALTSEGPEAFEPVVVCNGCSDASAAVARRHAPVAKVLELTEASKRLALARGDGEATVCPRLYVDADVELSAASARRLTDAVRCAPILAAAPVRTVPRGELSRSVRWYYDVWEQLPQVRTGLFGRGVIAVSQAGHERIRALPLVMGDDLGASEAFSRTERLVATDATVVVHGPRTLGALYRRRVRAVTGNA